MKNQNSGTGKKTPLKAPPLRDPGQSLRDEVDNRALAMAMFGFLFPGFVILLAAKEWWDWYSETPPQPVVISVYAVLISVFGIWFYFRTIKTIKRLKLGRDGERVVGQYLDEHLRPMGYRVFHDLVQKDGDGTKFNIDHIAIGPGGIFAIETKTRSKPAIGDPAIEFSEKGICLNDFPPDPAPIKQVRAAASRIRSILEEETGRHAIRVHSVILYPGWYIVPGSRLDGVWVLEPKAFPQWLEREYERLKPEDVALYATRISRRMREIT